MMNKRIFLPSLLLLLLFSAAVDLSFSKEKSGSRQPGVLKDIVLSKAQSVLKVRILYSPDTSHSLFELSSPGRLVIDLLNIDDIQTSRYMDVRVGKILAIRTGMFKTNVARVVFDLEDEIPPYTIERFEDGLKILFLIEELPHEGEGEAEIEKIQEENPKEESREVTEIQQKTVLQIREIKESLDQINEKLEEIKKILKDVVCTQKQIKDKSVDQEDQAGNQHEQRSILNDTSYGKRITHATPLNQDSIKIDGKLNEVIWEESLVLTDFTQHEPDEGAPASERTEVRIFFSEDSICVGVRAFDSDPEKIKAILARRDSECPSDWIRIWFDCYHDKLSAYEFGVNPAGVKRDVYWSNDLIQDDDWDAVWEVEVSKDGQGWMAEFRIPYSQVRYTEKEFHTWGFQASRVIARKNETVYWHHVPKGVPRFVSLFGDLEGITGIPSPKRLQLLPYTMGRSSFQPKVAGNPFRTGSSYLVNLGLDLKYGISSNLTLDAAFNPDFGQVEADPAQVNLTAYETYFPEKRPFFIEGKNMLNFPAGGIDSSESLFYSRRIGRDPQGYPSSARYSHIPENTTILGALKLTGKTAQGWSIGLMEALTGREQASVVTWEGERKQELVEPFTNYFLGRAEKEFRSGRSAIGMIFTAVNRKIEGGSLDYLRKAAYSGGFSFRHRWAKDTYEVSGLFVGSHILGSKEAILRAQQAPARYYQRPDATHLEVDPDRTSLSGYSTHFSLSKIGGGHWRWSMTGMVRSPGFEVNDMGYLRYADWVNHNVKLSYKEFKPGKVFRDYDISFSLVNDWDYSLTHLDHRESLNFNFRFLNYWTINLSLSRESEHLKVDYLRGGPGILTPATWRLNGSLSTDSRKDFFLKLSGNVTASEDGARSYGLSSEFIVRPFSNLDLSLSPTFSDGFHRLQYVTKISSDGQAHYILSRIDQTTFSVTLRVNFTLAPNLSLQLYSEPFVSAGDYNEFKEVIEPKAINYEDRWHSLENDEISLVNGSYRLFLPWTEGKEIAFNNPDFNFRQFKLNLVMRWEYLPGSILFLVWSNGINDYGRIGTLSLGDEFRSLFSSPADNVFLLKLSYWFNL